MKYLAIAVICILAITSCKTDKVKILIIGDSISIGYTPSVKENLADLAEVFHNKGNARHTGIGLEKIDEWLGDTDWDIIQFNWGLHDLAYRHPDSDILGNRDKVNGKLDLSFEDYQTNLDSLVQILKDRSNAKLVFVTTTFVPDYEAGRHAEDAPRYNDVAIKVMKKHGVPINDIFDKSIEIHKLHGRGNDDVHFTKEGYKLLGNEITTFLKTKLP